MLFFCRMWFTQAWIYKELRQNSYHAAYSRWSCFSFPFTVSRVWNCRLLQHVTSVSFLPVFTARCVCIARTMLLHDVRCLSVRVSVTRRYCVKTAKYVIVFFHFRIATRRRSNFSTPIIPYGSIPTEIHLTAASNAEDMKTSIYSTNISLYLANDTRQGHSHYGTPIGTHIQSTEWCHF